jgi:hypothetical protein
VRKLAVGLLALVSPAALALVLDTSGAVAAPSSTTSRSASIAYPGCPAGTVTLTVTVRRSPVPRGLPVRYVVALRNTRPQTCGPAHAITTLGPGGLSGSTLLTACGALPVVIENSRGEQVYPPFEAVMCPYLLPPKLEGKTTVTASLSWNQMEGGGRPARRAQLAPGGTYRVVVAGVPRASFVLPPRRGAAALTARPSGGPGTPRHPLVATTVTRSGHISFENCPRRDVVATVSVPARPTVGKPVPYTVSLHNVSDTPCGPSGNQRLPFPQPLRVGPCGILPAVVRNTSGVNIYPGPVAFSCPAEFLVDLPAHAVVTAMGTWPGSQAIGPAPPHVSAAPPGRYRIVVGAPPSVVSVPFTLVAPPSWSGSALQSGR